MDEKELNSDDKIGPEIAQEEQVLIQITVQFMETQDENFIRNPRISLHRKVFNNAEKKLAAREKFPYQKMGVTGTMYDSEGNKQIIDGDPIGPPRELYQDLIEGKERLMKTQTMNDWDEDNKQDFLKAMRHLKKDFMKGRQGPQLVFCTPAAASGDDVRPNIAERGVALAIMVDELSKVSDPSLFVGHRAQHANKIVAIWAAGDPKQLPSIQLTKDLKPAINEFASAHSDNGRSGKASRISHT